MSAIDRIESVMPEIVKQALECPQFSLTEDQSIEVLNYCISIGAKEATKAEGKDLLMVIGNTGAGKSTFVNWLAGCQIEQATRADAGLTEGNLAQKIMRVKPGTFPTEIMHIGHANKSATFLPEVFDDKSLGISHCDCPGFLDNRGAEINIANACNIKQMVGKASSVRTLVLINFNSLKADRGRGVKELLRILQDLFGGETDNLLKHTESILVGVSQVPRGYMDDDFQPVPHELDFVVAQLTDSSGLAEDQNRILKALSSQIFVFCPRDMGNKSWVTREQLIDRLETVVRMSDPSNIFTTVLTAEDQILLRDITGKMQQAAIDALGREEYETAAKKFGQLNSIDKIDNPQVARLLADAKINFKNHMDDIGRNGIFLAAQGKIDEAKKCCETLERVQHLFQSHFDMKAMLTSLEEAIKVVEVKMQEEDRKEREAEAKLQEAQKAAELAMADAQEKVNELLMAKQAKVLADKKAEEDKVSAQLAIQEANRIQAHAEKLALEAQKKADDETAKAQVAKDNASRIQKESEKAAAEARAKGEAEKAAAQLATERACKAQALAEKAAADAQMQGEAEKAAARKKLQEANEQKKKADDAAALAHENAEKEKVAARLATEQASKKQAEAEKLAADARKVGQENVAAQKKVQEANEAKGKADQAAALAHEKAEKQIAAARLATEKAQDAQDRTSRQAEATEKLRKESEVAEKKRAAEKEATAKQVNADQERMINHGDFVNIKSAKSGRYISGIHKHVSWLVTSHYVLINQTAESKDKASKFVVEFCTLECGSSKHTSGIRLRLITTDRKTSNQYMYAVTSGLATWDWRRQSTRYVCTDYIDNNSKQLWCPKDTAGNRCDQRGSLKSGDTYQLEDGYMGSVMSCGGDVRHDSNKEYLVSPLEGDADYQGWQTKVGMDRSWIFEKALR